MPPQEPDYIRAHRHCTRNREEIARSELCGCFHCLAIFPLHEVTFYLREAEEVGNGEGSTALCPKCLVDTVVGSAAGFPITPKLLRRMSGYWFGSSLAPSTTSTLRHRVRGYTVWIEAELWAPGTWNPPDDNTDVTVTFADGTRWFATFFSYANIATLTEKNRRTGESLSGRYFSAAAMVLIDEVSRERIEEVVAEMIGTGEFAAIFQRGERAAPAE
jgi:hypothetical protein